MATNFQYSRPDESIIGATVTGSVDADFLASYLCDGSPGTPAKKTGGLSLSATPPASTTVGIVAVCNHNIGGGGSATVGGSVTATITIPAANPNSIPFNNYALVSPAVTTGSAITIATAGEVIGEFWAGKLRTLERGLRVDSSMAPPEALEWEGEFGSIPPNDSETEARTLEGECVVSQTGLDDIEAWYRSTRRGVYPSLIIPFEGVNDAWLVTFSYTVKITWKHPVSSSNSIYVVSFSFKELPRTRW